MRWLIVVVLALASACSTNSVQIAQPSAENVGYDVTRDSEVAGRFYASVVYVSEKGVNVDEVKWRALLNGVEVIRKEGYDLVVWRGPSMGNVTQSALYMNSRVSAERKERYPALGYVVRGYRSDGQHPASARPIAVEIDRIHGEIARATRPR